MLTVPTLVTQTAAHKAENSKQDQLHAIRCMPKQCGKS